MGRSQSRVIVEVVALVALLLGIALSPWITVRYNRHRRKVVISFRSSLPRTSIDWHTTPPPYLVFVPWLGYSQHPPPSSIASASGHHSPRFLLGLVDSLGLTHHTFYLQPRGPVYMALVLLPSSVVVFYDACSWGSLKGFAADGLSQVQLLRMWVFFVFLTVGFFLGFR